MDRIGRYKIVGELGRGAMGVVYHATDPNIGRPVAIKTIRLSEVRNAAEQAKLRDRLFREARSAGMLSHPGIVTIYDVEQQDDLAFIAMEFVDGPTLDEVLSQDTPIPPDQMFSVLGQTAVALDYAHQKGIVHRDIKPANIMIAADGTTKITDFGIAKITTSEQFTMTGSIVGTPHYMSPEQVQGKPVDGRTDQFSLGVIVYEMLTGEKPFTGEHLTTVVFKIVAEEPPLPRRVNPTVTPQIESVLKRALAKKPDQRYRNCSEFIDALELACGASPGWKPLVRGGSLQATTVSDVARPPLSLPPSKRAQRASATTTQCVPERSGFLPFLMAILVAAGLLALIGWQAAPWLAQRTNSSAATTTTAQTASKPPETQPVPVNPPQPTAVSTEDKRPSPLDPAPVSAATKTEESGTPPGEQAPTNSETAATTAPEPPRRPEPVRTPHVQPPSPVSIITSPAGATATLDGRGDASCTTPCTLEAPAGRHTVAITLTGHQAESREVIATGGAQELPLITLRATAGTIMVTSVPPGAAILINGRQISQSTPAQINLAPGVYNITVQKDGRQQSRTVDVRNGAINYLKIPLE